MKQAHRLLQKDTTNNRSQTIATNILYSKDKQKVFEKMSVN